MPILYRAKKPLWLISKKKRAKHYKFACVAQMMQRLKFYEYDYEDQIRLALETFPEPPQVYPVQAKRLRRIVRKVLPITPTQEKKESEDQCLNPSTEFNCSVTSEKHRR